MLILSIVNPRISYGLTVFVLLSIIGIHSYCDFFLRFFGLVSVAMAHIIYSTELKISFKEIIKGGCHYTLLPKIWCSMAVNDFVPLKFTKCASNQALLLLEKPNTGFLAKIWWKKWKKLNEGKVLAYNF